MKMALTYCIEVSVLLLKTLVHIFPTPARDVVHRSTQLFGGSPATHCVFTVTTGFAIQRKSMKLERFTFFSDSLAILLYKSTKATQVCL